jgi:hypothetical protein
MLASAGCGDDADAAPRPLDEPRPALTTTGLQAQYRRYALGASYRSEEGARAPLAVAYEYRNAGRDTVRLLACDATTAFLRVERSDAAAYHERGAEKPYAEVEGVRGTCATPSPDARIVVAPGARHADTVTLVGPRVGVYRLAVVHPDATTRDTSAALATLARSNRPEITTWSPIFTIAPPPR